MGENRTQGEPADGAHREPERSLSGGERCRLQQRHDQQRRLRVRAFEERANHVVDVRHRRRVDGERMPPPVVDAERSEALPETPEEQGDGKQEHRAPSCSIDPSGPVQGPLDCD